MRFSKQQLQAKKTACSYFELSLIESKRKKMPNLKRYQITFVWFPFNVQI